MIIDHINNSEKYIPINPFFEDVFEFIKITDLNKLAKGTYELKGKSLRVIVSDEPGLTLAASIAEFECHRQHIDIQFCISGKETFGWKPLNTCMHPKTSFSEEKDVQFFEDAPDMFFELQANQFVILFPEDVHAPMISEGMIRKLIFKVRLVG